MNIPVNTSTANPVAVRPELQRAIEYFRDYSSKESKVNEIFNAMISGLVLGLVGGILLANTVSGGLPGILFAPTIVMLVLGGGTSSSR